MDQLLPVLKMWKGLPCNYVANNVNGNNNLYCPSTSLKLPQSVSVVSVAVFALLLVFLYFSSFFVSVWVGAPRTVQEKIANYNDCNSQFFTGFATSCIQYYNSYTMLILFAPKLGR